MKNSAHLLILSLSGIGNFLMHTPFITAIKAQKPSWNLTVWVAPRGTKILAENHPHIDQVLEMPIKANLSRHLKNIQQLRPQSFTHALMLSPGQQLKGALYMFLSGILQRFAHQYPFQGNDHSNLFLTRSIPEQNDLHDIDQNLNLLSLLDLEIPSPPHGYQLIIPQPLQDKAQQYLHAIPLPKDKRIIGIHPGSAQGFTWKRWPAANFIAVCKKLSAEHNAHILIFGGPDEQETNQAIHKALPQVSSVIATDLLTTAAIMQRCQLFISNDSGLMHLSAAAGVTTLGLFGPTSEQQTGPRGHNSHTLRAPNTHPTYNTENNFNLGHQVHPTLQALTVDQVCRKTQQLL